MKLNEVAIAEICETGSGGTPSRAKQDIYYGGPIPWVKSGELRESIITETEESLTELGLQESAAKLLPSDTLLVALYGATVGRIGILGIEAATNQAVCYLVPDDKRVNRRYLFHVLRSKVPYWLSQRVGGGQPNISQGVIKNTKIPLPPLPEQKRIAAILDQSEALRAKRRSAIKLLDELTQSIFLDMFGDPVTNPKGWKQRLLSEICIEISDINHKMPKAVSDGVPFISAKDLTDDGRISFDDVKRISQADFEEYAKKSCPRKGDILYSRIGVKLGKARIVEVDFPFLASYSCCIVRPNLEFVSLSYLCHLMDSPFMLKQAHSGIRAIAVPDLGLSEIKKFRVILPPRELQVKFEERISNLEVLKQKSRGMALSLDHLFASLQHRAFRGEL